MRVLVLSFYFAPDLSAGAFRATAFLKALADRLGPGDAVDVITTMPNRYHSFAREASTAEIQGAIRIRRIKLPGHKSGLFDQTRAFVVFAREALRHTRRNKYDIVFATSSRLFTASLGAMVARRARVPLYLDIRDIFADTIKDILSKPVLLFLTPVIGLIERYTINAAAAVNLVSGGFLPYFKDKYPRQTYSFHTNGIDDDFLGISFERASSPGRQTILYAGNIGEGQGLDRIIPAAAAALAKSHRFVIVGDGGKIGTLREAISRANVDNVELMPPVDRKRLVELYRESDYLFLHLNDYDAFKKVLPSKIFEYAATGKPIIAGVGGYAKLFIEENICNAAVFPPCNVEGFVNSINRIHQGITDRTAFIGSFARATIVSRMAEDFVALAGRKAD